MLTKVVHCNKEKFDVYIGRPSPWGNPWTHKRSNIAEFKVDTREQAVENFTKWLLGLDFTDVLQERRQWILDHIGDLKNQRLGCWCKPKKICHGDIYVKLLEYQNEIS